LNDSKADDVLGGYMNLPVYIVTATLLFTAQHPTMPNGMSHEEHLKQMEKDEALKKRGTDAMGFDQDATTHHFKLSATGGSIEVTVKNRTDAAVVTTVRDHLRSIAHEFTQGNFGKPFATHGDVPPGVTSMQRSNQAISYRYEDMQDGGVVWIDTTDVEMLKAVHEFLRYQITEHRTGDPLEAKH
jgi:hypothetical protein